MKFSDLVNIRFSVRKYKSQQVSEALLREILNSARMAPSAVNFQPWKFIVVSTSASLEKIHKTYNREWFKTAPVVIVACLDHEKSWKRGNDGKDFGDVDIAIAIDHLILQAAELGLGTCWICNFDAKMCSEAFNLPKNIEPIALIPVGFPDIQPPVKTRKSFKEIVFWENYGSTESGNV